MVNANVTNYGFDIQGHADYDEHGYDIVCAGISALSQSVALSLQRHCKVNVQATNGWLTVEIKEPNQISYVLLDTLRNGLYNISREYPKHLELRVKKGVF